MSNLELARNVKRMKYDSEVKKNVEKHSYTWILHNFFSVLVPKYNEGYFRSPVFGKKGSKYKWQIKCYPNCKREEYISLYLYRREICEFPVTCHFYFRNSNDKTLCQDTIKETFDDQLAGYGIENFTTHDKLKIMKDDILKIHATIDIIYNDGNLSGFSRIKLGQDLITAFRDNLDKDFILKVEDFELPVHKFIITARCPVFSAMLTNDTLEKTNGCMLINDIDKETLKLLIDFIYTGHTTELSYIQAKKLLYAANKYLLSDLEKICEEELIEQLKISNVGDILVLADRHNAPNLKAEALDFIVQNHWKFSKTGLLQTVAEESPKLLLEVISKLAEAISCTTKMA